jgi:hypothetical protein
MLIIYTAFSQRSFIPCYGATYTLCRAYCIRTSFIVILKLHDKKRIGVNRLVIAGSCYIISCSNENCDVNEPRQTNQCCPHAYRRLTSLSLTLYHVPFLRPSITVRCHTPCNSFPVPLDAQALTAPLNKP